MTEQEQAELSVHILAGEQKCQVCGEWKPSESFYLEWVMFGGNKSRFTYRACQECRLRADRVFH